MLCDLSHCTSTRLLNKSGKSVFEFSGFVMNVGSAVEFIFTITNWNAMAWTRLSKWTQWTIFSAFAWICSQLLKLICDVLLWSFLKKPQSNFDIERVMLQEYYSNFFSQATVKQQKIKQATDTDFISEVELMKEAFGDMISETLVDSNTSFWFSNSWKFSYEFRIFWIPSP